MSCSATKKYDLIIVGGGMVGLALAASLPKNRLKIAIIDPKSVLMSWPISEYDLRVSAISRASENLFREAGVWNFIGESEKQAYHKMSVWDGESSRGAIEFDAASIAQENIGHIIENRVIRRSLYQSLQARTDIDFLFEEKCHSVDYQDSCAELVLESGNKLSAKLLVAADGAFSWLRQASGIELHSKFYEHKAIVCTVKTEQPHQNTAYQRFAHSGPLAFLPLSDVNHCSIVWSLEPAKADALLALQESEFNQQIAKHFEERLGVVELISERLAFPLFERTAETTIQSRLALIGDAAHTIHPLAGQGVNLGFADAKLLAETITQANKKEKDIGQLTNLRAYQRGRKAEVFAMQQAMSAFKSFFEQSNPLLQMARSHGMATMNQMPLLKQMVIKKAMGL